MTSGIVSDRVLAAVAAGDTKIGFVSFCRSSGRSAVNLIFISGPFNDLPVIVSSRMYFLLLLSNTFPDPGERNPEINQITDHRSIRKALDFLRPGSTE